MLLLSLLLLPCLSALLALFCKPVKAQPWIFVCSGVLHLFLSFVCFIQMPEGIFGLHCDPPGCVGLLGMSLLFCISSIYLTGELAHRKQVSDRFWVACLCGLQASLTLVLMAQHLGLLLVAIEAAILFIAPMILWSGRPSAIQATWRFLLLQAFGMGISIIGIFLLFYAGAEHRETLSLWLNDLTEKAPTLSVYWVKAGLLCLIVGLGTQMGLAPMHIWKIQSDGEASGLSGALFSSGLTGAGLIALLRVLQIARAADLMAFLSPILLTLGIASMLLGAIVTVWQQQLKRLAACICIGQTGFLVLGIGLGGYAPLSVLLAWMGNMFCQGSLFLTADMVEQAYGDIAPEKISGALKVVPYSAGVLIISFLAVSGFPPFMLFYADIGIAQCLIRDGHDLLCGLYFISLMVTFLGMGRVVCRACMGPPPETEIVLNETPSRFFPPILLLAWAGVYGLVPPDYLIKTMNAAYQWLGGHL